MSSLDISGEDDTQEDEDQSFDPRHPRSAFSLFPPEHLLYCEECQNIKCSRCVTEEIVCWYCPSCLFETPSSMVRSEGHRCNRNCFNCPICTSQIITSSLDGGGPWVLNCNYCMWTSLEIGIKFDKPTNIRTQLDKIANGGNLKPSKKQPDGMRTSSLTREQLSPISAKDNQRDPIEAQQLPPLLDSADRFKALKTFYKDQIALSANTDPSFPASAADLAYSSPSSLARLMNLYSGVGGSTSSRRPRQKPSTMREALSLSEGLALMLVDPPQQPTASPKKPDYINRTTPLQRSFQSGSAGGNPTACEVSSLRPMSTLLRTKRAKRCLECKHILTKPETKPTSTRYRIRLTALNYIPSIALKPVPASGGQRPVGIDGGDVVLEALKPSQWILTLKNPLFENVKVSLGTPSVTPGKAGHKVTILCPQFEIEKNSDVWDEALKDGRGGKIGVVTSPEREQIAGKVYEKGRNWTSVVVEVVPAKAGPETSEGQGDEAGFDEDVVEIPIRVRLEWVQSDLEGVGKEKKSSAKLNEEGVDDGKRELAYWLVLGVGRVAG